MIIEYHRPSTLEEALELLARSEPATFPLGGGTVLNQLTKDEFAVVDLQRLGLSALRVSRNRIYIGAACRLQSLIDDQDPALPGALVTAASHEGSYNTRQVATTAGALVAADGRSPFAAVMLALDCELSIQPDDETTRYGDLLPVRHTELAHKLITEITFPAEVKTSYQSISRSPADLPVVSTAVCAWPSGRVRVVVGGSGEMPLLALDGKDSEGAEYAARNAASEMEDQWGSAEYRTEMAALLTRRAMAEIGASQ